MCLRFRFVMWWCIVGELCLVMMIGMMLVWFNSFRFWLFSVEKVLMFFLLGLM